MKESRGGGGQYLSVSYFALPQRERGWRCVGIGQEDRTFEDKFNSPLISKYNNITIHYHKQLSTDIKILSYYYLIRIENILNAYTNLSAIVLSKLKQEIYLILYIFIILLLFYLFLMNSRGLGGGGGGFKMLD